MTWSGTKNLSCDNSTNLPALYLFKFHTRTSLGYWFIKVYWLQLLQYLPQIKYYNILYISSYVKHILQAQYI